MIRKCTKCSNEFSASEKSHRSQCKVCRRPHDRAYRAKALANGTLWKAPRSYYQIPDVRFKYLARQRACQALRTGKITRGVCEVCGQYAHMHHEDYSKPLQVRWLCRVHHEELHHK